MKPVGMQRRANAGRFLRHYIKTRAFQFAHTLVQGYPGLRATAKSWAPRDLELSRKASLNAQQTRFSNVP